MICQLLRMRRGLIPVLLAAAMLPALAAEEKKEGEGAKSGKPGTNVDMPYLMAPMTGADGKLSGYAYISSRLTAASESYALTIRDKLPFIQDAFVRDVNTAPVTTADDPEKIDIPAVEARLLADAGKVVGAGKVKMLTVCTVQVAPLHPVQTPALHTPETPPPGAPAPKNPTKSRCQN